MTASTRFIGLALFAWAGVRGVSLGLVPGTSALAFDRPARRDETLPVAGLPPVHATEFAPIEPVASTPAASPELPPPEAPLPPPVAVRLPMVVPLRAPRPVRYAAYPVYYSSPAYADYSDDRQSPARVRLARAEAFLPEPRKLPFPGEPSVPDTPLERMAAAMPQSRALAPAGAFPADALAPPLARHSRKLELSSWALMRGKPGDLLGANSLAANGATLGGSQAGARLTFWIRPGLAASLRTSTPLGGARGGEVALGLRYQPFHNLPISVTAERRQRFGRAGGRNDFALFVEGGLWDRPMPAGFRLNAYAEAGVVGVKSHDLFGDGAFTLTRPLWGRISGGFGVWGGYQPGLYRLDAGPRLTIAMGKSMRVHVDYRQRLRGTAFPSSGPAVTIAGDF